jgi:hypothetical protein
MKLFDVSEPGCGLLDIVMVMFFGFASPSCEEEMEDEDE